jgi:hypothetical protein
LWLKQWIIFTLSVRIKNEMNQSFIMCIHPLTCKWAQTLVNWVNLIPWKYTKFWLWFGLSYLKGHIIWKCTF